MAVARCVRITTGALAVVAGLLLGLRATIPKAAMTVASPEMQEAAVAMVRAFDEQVQIAQGKFKVLSRAAIETGSSYSVIAQVKLGVLAESALKLANEYSASLSELLAPERETFHELCARVYEHSIILKDWLTSDEPVKVMRNLYASAALTARHALKELLSLASSLFTNAQSWKAWYISVTVAERVLATVGMMFLVLLVVAIAGRLGAFCCHRRCSLPAVHSMEHPTSHAPVNCTIEHTTEVTPLMKLLAENRSNKAGAIRRRSESPAPLAQQGKAKEQDENANVNSNAGSALLCRLNSADADELKSIQGLGDKTVDKFLKYRMRTDSRDLQDIKELVTEVGMSRVAYASFLRMHSV